MSDGTHKPPAEEVKIGGEQPRQDVPLEEQDKAYKSEGQDSNNDTSDADDTAISTSEDEISPRKANLIRQIWEWKPKPARYDPKNPPEFTLFLNLLFGFVSRPKYPKLRQYLTLLRQQPSR
jgi:hypothetical protein